MKRLTYLEMEELTMYRYLKKKYTNIDPEDPDYDRQYVHQALDRVTTLVKTKIHERYKLTFGEDLDFSDPG